MVIQKNNKVNPIKVQKNHWYINKKIIPTRKIGTIFKNFSFNVCDLIIQPRSNNSNEIDNVQTNIISTTIKAIKRTDVIIFSKLFK